MKDHQLSCLCAHAYVKEGDEGDDADAKFSRRLTYGLKDNKPVAIDRKPVSAAAHFAAETVAARQLHFFSGATLVPVPRSTVTPQSPDPDTWPGLRLAAALNERGCGAEPIVALRRAIYIRPASKCSGPDRPTVQEHLETLEVNLPALRKTRAIVLIDDVLTRGTMLMACARKLQLAGYTGMLSAFTVAHRIGLDLNAEKFRTFSITWTEGDSFAARP